MNTLLLSEIFPPKTGGSGRWFWELYRRLPAEDYVIAAGEDPQQKEFDSTHTLRVHRLPLTLRAWGLRSFTGLSGYWQAIRHLGRLVRSEQVSRVHVGRCLPEGVMALGLKLRYRLPYLCYIHGEDVTTARDSREHAWLVRRVVRNAEYLIANSQNTARILREEWGLPAERVCVLHPGVDTNYFTPAPTNVEVRKRLGWNDRPVALTVGRLQKRKGQDMMIRALPAIRRALPNILYSIGGAGEERAALEALAVSEGVSEHVQFLGEVNDSTLLDCYRQCDLCALPNRQVGRDIEGFGMVLLEAQSCGKPVLAGASGGTAETMRIPETGRVVPCDEPGPLAGEVIDLLSDSQLRQRMGQSARAWVVEHFDWDALRQKAERLFCSGPVALAAPRPQAVGCSASGC
jgi:phosphatidylinositol alpha-1,6-mannosyltransferase